MDNSRIVNYEAANIDAEENVRIMEEQIENIKNNILQTQAKIQMHDEDIKLREQALQNKNSQIQGQEMEIKKKMELLETRNRQLQLSMDRNIFKKKIIYTLLSLIIAIFIIILVSYVFLNK